MSQHEAFRRALEEAMQRMLAEEPIEMALAVNEIRRRAAELERERSK